MLVEFVAGEWRAVVAPQAGCALMSLQYQAHDVLRPAASFAAVKADPREAACYPCVPWFGRLSGGLVFADTHYDLAPTLPACDPENPLHGEGWINPWRIAAQDANSLECRFDYAPQPMKFPFPFRASQQFAIDGEAFSIRLAVENTGDRPMPAGLALHPFFVRGANTRLMIDGARDWRPAPFDLPPHGALPDRDADHTAEHWNGAARIDTAGLALSLESDARHAHLFTPMGENFFCLEPVTHLPGKFGECVLAPGITAELTCKISVKALP